MKKVYVYIALVILLSSSSELLGQTLTKDAVFIGGDGDRITLGAPASVDAQKLLLPGTLGSAGSLLYISNVSAGPIGSTSWLAPASNGAILVMIGGVPTWISPRTATTTSVSLPYWLTDGNDHSITDGTNNLLGTITANPLRIVTGSGGPNTRILISATGDVTVNGTAGTANLSATSLGAATGTTGRVMFATNATGQMNALALPVSNGQVLTSTTAGVLSWTSSPVLNAWNLTGNGHTVVDGTDNLLGTTTAAPLRLITGGAANTRVLISATGDVTVNGTAGTANTSMTSLGATTGSATGRIVLATATTGQLNALALPVSNGQILTSTTAGVLSWTSSPTLNFWGLSGNAATTAGTNFLGTTDNVAFEIHVDEAGTATEGRRRVMRFEPNATSANILGGFSSNGLGLGTTAVGVTITGGGQNGLGNRASDNFGFVGGGAFNRAGSNDATVTNAQHATVVGGLSNNASGSESFVGGGNGNIASGSQSSLVGGSGSTASGANSAIGGGGTNVASGQYSTISGGSTNTTSGVASSVLGGTSNTAGGDYTSVAGGRGLTLSAAGSFGFLGNNGAGANNATVTSANTAYLGNVNLWLFSNDNTARQMRFYEAQNTNNAFPAAGINYSSFQAGAQSADFNYTLPTTIPTAGQVLTASAVAAPAVTLSWTSPGAGSNWALTGNSGTTVGTNFVGTTDEQALLIQTATTTGSGQDIRFNTDGTERVRISGSGEVGIGTTATSGKLLHVSGTGGATPNVRIGTLAATTTSPTFSSSNDGIVVADGTTGDLKRYPISTLLSGNGAGIFAGTSGQATSNGDYYIANGHWHGGNNEDEEIVIIPSSGTLRGLYARVSTAPGANRSKTITVRVNNTNTTLTVTISGTNTTGSDLTNTVSVSAGDLLSMIVTHTNSPSSSIVAWGFVLD
jgi:hypothetical protein